MEFPVRNYYHARTEDPNLVQIMGRVNQCCGTLKGLSKNSRNAFFSLLEAYNCLYNKKDKTQEETDWAHELLVAVRFLSSTSGLDRKEKFVKDNSHKLLEILSKIGI